MAKPTLPPLLSRSTPTYEVEILKIAGQYSVIYDGDTKFTEVQRWPDGGCRKYSMFNYSSPGMAHRACRKLNEEFNTDLFAVYELNTGAGPLKDPKN